MDTCSHVRGMGTDTQRFCVKCGYEFGSAQHSERSAEGATIHGSVGQASRGYYITLSDVVSGASHTLTQKRVKEYEAVTGLKREALAEHLATHCASVRSDWNGKYPTSSASVDLRTAEQKDADAAKRAEYDAARVAETAERNARRVSEYAALAGAEFTVEVSGTEFGEQTIDGMNFSDFSEKIKSAHPLITRTASDIWNVADRVRMHLGVGVYRIKVGADPFYYADGTPRRGDDAVEIMLSWIVA